MLVMIKLANGKGGITIIVMKRVDLRVKENKRSSWEEENEWGQTGRAETTRVLFPNVQNTKTKSYLLLSHIN